MMGFKKNNYESQWIDKDLADLIKEFRQEGVSFREASRIFANHHKEIKWEIEAKRRMFNLFVPAVVVWGMGYIILMNLLP